MTCLEHTVTTSEALILLARLPVPPLVHDPKSSPRGLRHHRGARDFITTFRVRTCYRTQHWGSTWLHHYSDVTDHQYAQYSVRLGYSFSESIYRYRTYFNAFRSKASKTPTRTRISRMMEPFELCNDCVTLAQWLISKPGMDDVHCIPKSGEAWLASMRTCQMCIRLGYWLPLECENVIRCDVTLQYDIHQKIAALNMEFRRDPDLWLSYKVYVWADEGIAHSQDVEVFVTN